MVKRRSKSIIGASIASPVKDFLIDNAKVIENNNKITLEESMLDLAHAISYGICKSLSSSQMQTSFAAGICPLSGGPVGNLIFAQIKVNTIES